MDEYINIALPAVIDVAMMVTIVNTVNFRMIYHILLIDFSVVIFVDKHDVGIMKDQY